MAMATKHKYKRRVKPIERILKKLQVRYVNSQMAINEDLLENLNSKDMRTLQRWWGRKDRPKRHKMRRKAKR